MSETSGDIPVWEISGQGGQEPRASHEAAVSLPKSPFYTLLCDSLPGPLRLCQLVPHKDSPVRGTEGDCKDRGGSGTYSIVFAFCSFECHPVKLCHSGFCSSS